jgi:hypothetical protein
MERSRRSVRLPAGLSFARELDPGPIIEPTPPPTIEEDVSS